MIKFKQTARIVDCRDQTAQYVKREVQLNKSPEQIKAEFAEYKKTHSDQKLRYGEMIDTVEQQFARKIMHEMQRTVRIQLGVDVLFQILSIIEGK